VYGVAVFGIYTALVGQSLLLVYLVNLALIIVFLALDEASLKIWDSKMKVAEKLARLKDEKEIEKNYRLIQLYFDSFVSFKAVLYLFYILILIIARVIEFYPALLSENLTNFVSANDYSILVLIAADQLVGQFSKDKAKIEKISAKFNKDFAECKSNIE
jgi:hypothetical protein